MSTGKPTPAPGSSPDSPQAVGRALQMRHPATGESVHVPLGYSLPVLLLGPIELARRRDWRLVAVSVLLPIVGQILVASSANRSYLKLLLRQGFRAVSPAPGYIGRIEWQLGMLLPRYTGRSNKSAD